MLDTVNRAGTPVKRFTHLGLMLVTVGLVPPVGHGIRAEDRQLCGTTPELPSILSAFHRGNAAGIESASVARAQLSGGLGDRIENDLLVLEDAGDLVVNGTTDTTEIVRRAIDLAGDRFDFITVLTAGAFPGNVEPETGFAFFQMVNSSVQGVGLPTMTDPTLSRLKGFINLNDLDEYPSGPDGTIAGFNGLVTGVEVLGQETSHWTAAYIQAPAAPLLGRDASHWSFYLNSYGSVLEGNAWVDNGDGTFTTAPAAQQFNGYSQLDLYLWGLMGPGQVTDPIYVITSPASNPGQGRFSFPQPGFTTAGVRTPINMTDIVNANGPRHPAWPSAPSQFTMAFVLVTPFGQPVAPADMTLATQFRTRWESWFASRTGDRGAFQTAIPPIPVTGDFAAEPRAGGPAPMLVRFDSHLGGTVTGVTWDFGDGSSSSEPNPQHAYQTNGLFTVRLTVQGDSGPMVVSKPGFIAVGSFTTILQDDFETDTGWSVDPAGTATGGFWERADPSGTVVGSTPAQPEDDHTPAPGALCWVTGAATGGSPGANDVDGGVTALVSPVFSLAGRERAFLAYALWFDNDLGTNPGADPFRVEVSNDGGTSWSPLQTVGLSAYRWRLFQVPLPGSIAPTSQMRLRFLAADLGPPSLVEAALDDVVVIGIPPDDFDLDGVSDSADDCPGLFNPSQQDSDQDGPGDACDCAPLDAGVSLLPGDIGPTLRFVDADSLQWQPIPQAVTYDVYRGACGPGQTPAYNHVCLQPGVGAATFTDTDAPPPGAVFYYLVTGRNCFGEGTAGPDSAGNPRPIPSACP